MSLPTELVIAALFAGVFLVLPLANVFGQAFAKGWQAAFGSLTDPDTIAATKLTALATLISVPLNTVFGVRSVEKRLFEAASMLGCSPSAQFTKVVLPAALPSILVGVRFSLGLVWVLLIVAETISAQAGIGYMTMSASHFLATDAVFVGIGIIAACAFSFSLAMRLLERVLVPWKGKS